MNDQLVETYHLPDCTNMPRLLHDDPRIHQAYKEAALRVAHALPGRGDAIELWSVCLSADERVYVLRARTCMHRLSVWERQSIDATGHAGDTIYSEHGTCVEVQP
jgi:hypothetical protein